MRRLQYSYFCSIIFLVKMESVEFILTKDNRQLSKVEKNAEGWIVAMSRSSRMYGHIVIKSNWI